MEVKMIMARYGELSTKGKNKKDLLKSTILILKIPCMGGQASSTMES